MKKISKLRKKQIIVLAILLIVLVGAFFWLKPSFFRQEESLSQKPEDGIVSSLETQETSYKKINAVLTFAVIADVHLGADPVIERYLKEALKKADDFNVEFVVLIGDLTQKGTLEEFQDLEKILDESGLAYYLIPGNHDTGLQAVEEGFENFQSLFGPTYKEVIYKLAKGDSSKNKTKMARLFLLDTSRIGMDVEMIMDKEQWLWLKGKLDGNVKDESELRLVFSQTPFDKFGTESYYLREFFCESYVDGFFEADDHRTEFFCRNCPISGWEERTDVAQAFSTFKPGALFKPDNEFPGFLIMEYYDNHYFNFKKVFVGD